MKSGRNHAGFTIVETLIVLAVTSAILISALAMLSGSQNKAEFNQSINDVNQVINGVSSNVANGYYNNSIVKKQCKAATSSTSNPEFEDIAGPAQQGTSKGCIFLGRVIHFTKGDTFYVYDVVGRQQTNNPPEDVVTILQARPQIIEAYGSVKADYPTTTQELKLKFGLEPGFVRSHNGTAWVDNSSAVAFVSSLGGTGSTGSSSLSVDFGPTVFSTPIALDNPLNTRSDFIKNFDANNGFMSTFDSVKNPAKGVAICFDSGTTNQYGLITIGSERQSSATILKIGDGGCDAVVLP